MNDNRIIFCLGGARSGKSAHAESLAIAATKGIAANADSPNLSQPHLSQPHLSEPNLYYVATAQIFDDEMQQRVDLHRQRRGDQWHLLEAPMELTACLAAHDHPNNVILVDCLSVWVTNLLVNDADIPAARDALLAQLETCQAHIIFVASETGLGIVPDNKLSRRFRDESGILNQRIAACAAQVFFVTAGIANQIKP